MNTGEQAPKQAVRPRWAVRLVSFAAATVLTGLILFGVALLRYPLEWRTQQMLPAVLVSEVARPEPPSALPAPPPPRRTEEAPAPDGVRSPALAPTAPEIAEPPTITTPTWIVRPRNPERFYPREAFMQGVSGQVVLDCIVETNGRLQCLVASETPPDRGFGAAALALAAAHVMQPAIQDGTPVRARYRMIVPFTTGG